jgi:hypothetical protein
MPPAASATSIGAVILTDHAATHVLRSQACSDALDHQCEALAGLLRFGEEAQALVLQQLHVDRQQFEVADWRQQLDLGEMLGQQAGQVLDVAGRARRAYGERAAVVPQLRDNCLYGMSGRIKRE